ncbi:MAG: hypothetical protein NZ937_08815 [Armatimonadetes bacterium]|nr:hypothetical protein [Armatimonadota bacterium]
MKILSLSLILLLLVLTFAFGQSDRSRCVILLPPLSFGSLSTGSIVIVPSSGGLIFPGSISTLRPPLMLHPTVVLPAGGFFCFQLQGSNWSITWCEPLKTNVVIIGRPLIRPFIISPGFFDPSVTYGVPQIWHSPILQPGVLTFRLRNRSAEEVAKLLNEAKVVPDGRFSGVGNILIVSAPSLATSGVQQSRIRDLIAELDKPDRKNSSLPSDRKQVQWQVEVYRAHSSNCIAQENLPSDRMALVKLSGYPCAHKIGETLWKPETQEVLIKSEGVDLSMKAAKQTSGWRFSLKGQVKGQPTELESEAPETSQPILLIAPISDEKEGLIIAILPKG